MISYWPCQSTAKLFFVSSVRAGRGSPASATRVARQSAGSSIHASPLSVENSSSGPIVTAAGPLRGQPLNVPDFVAQMDVLSLDPAAVTFRVVLAGAPPSRRASTLLFHR